MAEERGRVLVVDDEESVRDLLQRILEGAAYNVVTAADGQETLDKMSELDIEVVLLDIKMPGMSGIEVLQQLTAYYPDICVIMVTAIDDAQTAVETMKLGAYDYIIKPLNPAETVLTVQRAIEKRDLWLENKRHRVNLEKRISEQAKQL
ncbi:MAG: response regulator, partial [candidate division Zixibacteria bacterium]|nr:response regulator [candidate division Zixibacteria bacterium]